MKVRFLVNADISGKIKVDKGEIFEAKEDRGYIIYPTDIHPVVI